MLDEKQKIQLMVNAYQMFQNTLRALEGERQTLVMEAKKRFEQSKMDEIMAKLKSL